MKLGADRRLADALGGLDGGWYFWAAALCAVERAVARSREREMAFSSYPTAELGRFLRDLDEAVSLARVACRLQDALNGEGDPQDTLLDALTERLLALRSDLHPPGSTV